MATKKESKTNKYPTPPSLSDAAKLYPKAGNTDSALYTKAGNTDKNKKILDAKTTSISYSKQEVNSNEAKTEHESKIITPNKELVNGPRELAHGSRGLVYDSKELAYDSRELAPINMPERCVAQVKRLDGRLPDGSVDLIGLINPTEKQKAFLMCLERFRYILYGGAAGGGKSYIGRWGLVYLLMKWYAEKGLRDVEVGLFCETYPTLMSRQVSKMKTEFPEWMGQLKDSDNRDLHYRLNDEYGGGYIRLRNLDNPEKFKSSEFAAVMVDELTLNPYEIFGALRFRMRWTGIERTIFIGATNPNGPGSAWVKNLWVDRNFPKEIADEDAELWNGKMGKLKDEFVYIPAKTIDNPHLSKNYDRDLAGLPEALRRAYRDGSWDHWEGQVFTEWDRDTHVVTPFAIPRHWQRFMSYDHGYAKPYACLWFAVDEDGYVYLYRELYGCRDNAPNVGVQEDAATIATRIADIEKKAGEGDINGGPFIYRVADPAIWNKGGQDARYLCVADVFSSKGIHFTHANNNRLQGWAVMHEFLRCEDAETGDPVTPRLRVFQGCLHTIRTVPSLPYDRSKVEDVDSDSEDHIADALRYGLMTRPRPSDHPIEPREKGDWYYEKMLKEMNGSIEDDYGYATGPRSWLLD